MGRIRLLPDAVVNKIAAGEVVERPASVLKELLENALDAGAARVDVWIEGGGRGMVKVVDDGCGMAPDDALLAFDRHATSKIGSAEELTGVATLGFRGEALPSIAAVSRTTLVTRRGEDLAATVVVVDGGRVRSSGEGGGPPGTAVEVRDLFYNVPARRAFLRAPATETARLQETFSETALSRPDVAFSLTIDGRRAVSLPTAEGRLERATLVFGEEYTGRMAPVSGGAGEVTVEGLVSRPGFDFGGWDHLHTLVNGRPVRAPLLLKAIAGAFASYAAPGRKPAAILWVTVPGESLDVNVHPTKREVRFRDGGTVARAVEAALAAALGDRRAPYAAGAGAAAPGGPDGGRGGGPASGETGARPWTGGGTGRAWQGDPGWLPDRGGPPEVGTSIDFSPVQDLFLFEQGYRLLGQWLGTYLLVESGRSLYLVDQHVAHERVLFERYRKELEQHVVSQEFLVPPAIGVPPSDLPLLEDASEGLAGMGIVIEPAGPASVRVRSLPAGVPPEEAEALVRDLPGILRQEGSPATAGFRERAAARLACSAAIKAGERLGEEAALDLLRQLAATDNPYRCPHGRPIIVSIPGRSVERAFGRE